MLDYFGDDTSAVEDGCADVCFTIPTEHEHAEINRRAHIGRKAINIERLIGLHPVLSAAGAYYCVNGLPPGGSALAPAADRPRTSGRPITDATNNDCSRAPHPCPETSRRG